MNLKLHRMFWEPGLSSLASTLKMICSLESWQGNPKHASMKGVQAKLTWLVRGPRDSWLAITADSGWPPVGLRPHRYALLSSTGGTSSFGDIGTDVWEKGCISHLNGTGCALTHSSALRTGTRIRSPWSVAVLDLSLIHI